MTTTPTTHTPGRDTPPPSRGGDLASGGTVFAGILLLVYGVIGIFQGIAGIAEDDVYARIGDYVFEFNTTTWGWIHLILGVIAVIAGYGILKGAYWARATGVALASLVVIANFLWLPYQPLWAIVVIGIGVFVIWSLCTDTSESLL